MRAHPRVNAAPDLAQRATGSAQGSGRSGRQRRFIAAPARPAPITRRTLRSPDAPQLSAMTTTPDRREARPPFWLPVLAGLPLGACLLLIALPILGQGQAGVWRSLYLLTFVLWILPLTALQRWLWRRGEPLWRMSLALLAVTYLMALCTRALGVPLLARSAASADWTLLLRGLEASWLVLVAFCAVHAVVAYYAELRHEQDRRARALALMRDAELRALRYQLQPHFLFNALNAISALIDAGQGDRARTMLARLGDLLRSTLREREGEETLLAEEIAMTEAYLDVEKARLGERLRVSWRLGPEVLAARVPSLLLQPLVENAIRHGIAPRTGGGHLDIAIEATDEQLRIRLENDLPEDVAPRAASAPAAVGLDNIRARLAWLSSDAAMLNAGEREDGRYRVELALPLRLAARPRS